MVAMESRWLCCGLWVLCFIMLLTSPTSVVAKEKRQTRAIVEVDNPEEVVSVLSNLVQNLIQASSIEHDKRNLDLGFSRGFSGGQAAKHLMGLAAANFAGGPGRRKRSAE